MKKKKKITPTDTHTNTVPLTHTRPYKFVSYRVDHHHLQVRYAEQLTNMAYYDSKYDVDEETAKLPSTVEFFPSMIDFEFEEDQCEPTIIPAEIKSDWARRKLGTLQSELDKKQYAREANHFGSKYNNKKFSKTILYGLANKVFGFDGWSTSLESCFVEELPVEEEGKHSTRCSIEIKLILKDGSFIIAFGIGDSTNMPHKYMSYQTAKKKAVTEAMKSAITGMPYLCIENGDSEETNFDKLETELKVKYGI